MVLWKFLFICVWKPDCIKTQSYCELYFSKEDLISSSMCLVQLKHWSVTCYYLKCCFFFVISTVCYNSCMCFILFFNYRVNITLFWRKFIPDLYLSFCVPLPVCQIALKILLVYMKRIFCLRNFFLILLQILFFSMSSAWRWGDCPLWYYFTPEDWRPKP